MKPVKKGRRLIDIIETGKLSGVGLRDPIEFNRVLISDEEFTPVTILNSNETKSLARLYKREVKYNIHKKTWLSYIIPGYRKEKEQTKVEWVIELDVNLPRYTRLIYFFFLYHFLHTHQREFTLNRKLCNITNPELLPFIQAAYHDFLPFIGKFRNAEELAVWNGFPVDMIDEYINRKSILTIIWNYKCKSI